MSCETWSFKRHDLVDAVRILLGSVIVVFLMLQVYYAEAPVVDLQIVRFLAALTAGLLFDFVGGKVLFKAKIRSVVISAAGAAGLFSLVFMMWEVPAKPVSTAKVRSSPMELQGAVVFRGIQNGRWILRVQETGDEIKTDDSGFFHTVLTRPPELVHINLRNFPYVFEVRLPQSASAAFVNLDITQPTSVSAVEVKR